MAFVVHTVLKYDGYVCCSKWAFSVLAYFYFHMSTLYFSTAEAVLQKMDDMEKMRRRQRMGNLEEFPDTEEVDTDLFCWFCIIRVFHIEKLFPFPKKNSC